MLDPGLARGHQTGYGLVHAGRPVFISAPEDVLYLRYGIRLALASMVARMPESTSDTGAGLSSSPLRGIVLSVLGAGCIVVNDAAMKWVVSEHPIGQAIGVRGVFVLAGLGVLALLHRRSRGILRWRRPGAQFWAALMLTIPIFVYIFSLSQLPLSLATLIFFVNPFFVTLMAPWLAGETVGWRRRMAVLVGFVGAAVVIRPGGAEFHWILLGPVFSAFMAAWRDLYLRRVLVHETSLAVLLWSTVMVTLAAGATYPMGWPALSGLDLLLLLGAAVGFALGIYLTTEALRFADASLLATFKYSAIVWALVIGYLVWSEIPDDIVALGAALIVGSGLYIVYRERLLRSGEP